MIIALRFSTYVNGRLYLIDEAEDGRYILYWRHG